MAPLRPELEAAPLPARLPATSNQPIPSQLKALEKPEDPSISVPVTILCLIAQAIVKAPYVWERTPDLLHVLAQLEMVRQGAFEQAELALEFQKHLSEFQNDSSSQGVRLLTPAMQARLKELADQKANGIHRKTFCLIIREIRLHHLRHLLRARDYTAFQSWLDIYFPHLDQLDDREHAYLRILSSDELKIDARTKVQAQKLREEDRKWRKDREMWFKDNAPNIKQNVLYGEGRFISYVGDWEKEFPPKTPLEQLLTHVTGWVIKTEQMTTILAKIFATDCDAASKPTGRSKS